jgi:hypothetical protein
MSSPGAPQEDSQLLGCFARNNLVKRIVRIRQLLRVGLRQIHRAVSLGFHADDFFLCNLQRGARKIRAKHPGAAGSQKPGKAAPAAGPLQHSLAVDRRQLFYHQLLPRTLLVVVLGRLIGDLLMPIVGFCRQTHLSTRM